MDSTPFRAALAQRELRLHIGLSSRCERAGFIALWHRLDAYLIGSGLRHSLGLCSLVVCAEGRDIHPLERALLLAWLALQPELVRVRVNVSVSGANGDRHGQA